MKEAKVLVIDDDPSVLETIVTSLKIPNYNLIISTAADASGGLKVIERELPDLILLDLNMPETGGFNLVETIRKVPKWRHIKIMIMTSESTKEKLWESIDLDIEDFISKPFDLLDLGARVFQQLHRQESGFKTSSHGDGGDH